MSDFYNNLFAVEITAFGIITAVILVLMQLFHGQFSYRQVGLIFRSGFFALILLMSSFTVVVTCIASVLLALPYHDFFPKVNFHSREIFLNGFTPIILVFLFFLSMFLFIVWILINLRYLKPSNTLVLEAERIKQESIKEFVLKQYGVSRPQPKFEVKTEEEGESGELSITLRTEETENHIKERYERIKKKVKSAKDPFEPLIPIIVKALKESDLTTIDDFCDFIVRISDSFIGSFGKRGKHSDQWDPYDDLIEKYLHFLTDYLRILMELTEKHQLILGKLRFLQASQNIAKGVVKNNNSSETKVILEFWKGVADASIGCYREVFIDIINNYKGIADYAFEKGQVENEYLKDIFRCLSWLGERMLAKEEIEERPLMWSESDTSTFDVLLYTLLSYESEYIKNFPNLYPLIYFDAIEVLFIRMLELYTDSKRKELRNKIFDCVFVYYSFGKAAISVPNEDGAALATFKLCQCYKNSLKRKAFDIASDIADSLVRLGGCAAANNDKLSGKSFLNSRLDDHVIKCLEEIIPNFNYDIELERVIIDIVISGEGDTDTRWDFVKKLGKTLQTNFGMNFDWHTGERLAN